MVVPLPNTRLIHPRFEAHHRPVVEGAMTITVRVSRQDQTGVRNPATGVTTWADPTLVYEGPARLLATGAGTPSMQADRTVTQAPYLLMIPAGGTAPQARDVAEVLACTGDASLVGLELSVVDLPRSGLSWQRNLACDVYSPTRRKE